MPWRLTDVIDQWEPSAKHLTLVSAQSNQGKYSDKRRHGDLDKLVLTLAMPEGFVNSFFENTEEEFIEDPGPSHVGKHPKFRRGCNLMPRGAGSLDGMCTFLSYW